MSLVVDLTGRVFGRLTVLSRSGSNNRGRATWNCVCECGSHSVTLGNHLLSGNTSSCGCGQKDAAALARSLSTTHGRSEAYYYGIWMKMISRCYNPKDQSFKYYGARGIKVCSFLKSHPDNFIFLVGHRPKMVKPRQYSIDRINNSVNYSCGTCDECVRNGWGTNLRWATAQQQADNRRSPQKRKTK